MHINCMRREAKLHDAVVHLYIIAPHDHYIKVENPSLIDHDHATLNIRRVSESYVRVEQR
jgi:hypothetical protein